MSGYAENEFIAGLQCLFTAANGIGVVTQRYVAVCECNLKVEGLSAGDRTAARCSKRLADCQLAREWYRCLL